MRSEPVPEGEPLAAVVADVEAGNGPVMLVRPGHAPVVLVAADEWQQLQDVESAESTAWWRRDAAQRTTEGEGPDAGEAAPGIDESELRRRFSHLLPGSTGAA